MSDVAGLLMACDERPGDPLLLGMLADELEESGYGWLREKRPQWVVKAPKTWHWQNSRAAKRHEDRIARGFTLYNDAPREYAWEIPEPFFLHIVAAPIVVNRRYDAERFFKKTYRSPQRAYAALLEAVRRVLCSERNNYAAT